MLELPLICQKPSEKGVLLCVLQFSKHQIETQSQLHVIKKMTEQVSAKIFWRWKVQLYDGWGVIFLSATVL